MIKEIKITNYWILLCREEKAVYFPCGIYASKKEAEEVEKEIRGCPGKHLIRKCGGEISINF